MMIRDTLQEKVRAGRNGERRWAFQIVAMMACTPLTRHRARGIRLPIPPCVNRATGPAWLGHEFDVAICVSAQEIPIDFLALGRPRDETFSSQQGYSTADAHGTRMPAMILPRTTVGDQTKKFFSIGYNDMYRGYDTMHEGFGTQRNGLCGFAFRAGTRMPSFSLFDLFSPRQARRWRTGKYDPERV